MLIVAIPKSASTALLSTIGETHGINTQQRVFPELSKPKEYPILSQWHNDIRDYNTQLINQFVDPTSLHKQHIPPTENNIRELNGKKFVILLRNPQDIISAYYRADLTNIHQKRFEMRDCVTLNEWHHKSAINGLFAELKSFERTWRRYADTSSNAMCIDYTSLITHPTDTINIIERFFLLPQSHKVKLIRKRYSRGVNNFCRLLLNKYLLRHLR